MDPTWVFVVGTYRTGSTTQYLLTEAIVERTESGIGIGYEKESKLIEFDKPENGRYVVAKVFKFLPETSEQCKRFLKEGRLKVVGTTRDPRDIAVSMQERSRDLGNDNWDFRTTVTRDFPIWLGQFERWANLEPELVLVTRFEDMIVDLEKEITRIAQHLDIKVSEDLVYRIAADFTLPAQTLRKRRFFERKDRSKGREHPMLPSLPGVKFGTSGHWRTWLTSVEARLVQKHARAYMIRWSYPL